MKKAFYSSFIVFVALTIMSFITIHGPLQIGESGAAAFGELTTNMDGTDAPLRAYVQKNGMVILFSSNDCNYSNNWEDRYAGLAKYCNANGLGFVVINSNATERSGNDSFQAMKEHAKTYAYTFPYLVDHNAAIAHILGAKITPQVFLFDSNFRLVYRGLIDDNHKDASKVNTTYALNAMRNYISGSSPDPVITTEIGCKIKDVK